MKVKEGTWHLRLVDFWCEKTTAGRPESLCAYFWRVVGGVTVFPLLWPPALGVAWLIEGSLEHFDREPGLFRTWVKAKKDRVCPLMEYES